MQLSCPGCAGSRLDHCVRYVRSIDETFKGEPMRTNILRSALVAIGACATAALNCGYAHAQSSRWSGFYMGLNAGGAWTSSTTTNSQGADPFATNLFQSFLNQGLIPTSMASSYASPVIGAQAGYNWQLGSLILGVEADFDAIRGEKVSRVDTSYFGYSYATETKLNQTWLASLRGRVGFAIMRDWMLYGTGGFAFSDANVSVRVTCPRGCDPVNDRPGQADLRRGLMFGAGTEFAFTDHVSFRAEFLHFELGKANSSAIWQPSVVYFALDNLTKESGNLARLGINYRF